MRTLLLLSLMAVWSCSLVQASSRDKRPESPAAPTTPFIYYLKDLAPAPEAPATRLLLEQSRDGIRFSPVQELEGAGLPADDITFIHQPGTGAMTLYRIRSLPATEAAEPQAAGRWQVISRGGAALLEGRAGTDSEIDISALPPGIYTLRYDAGGSVSQCRIVRLPD